jgi:uncharacterized protein (DUF433 family)
MPAESVSEAKKMKRVPGIIFADGPLGRRARIAGTGIDVFEMIKAWRSCDEDRDAIVDAFDWLTPDQLEAAFAYYAAFPEEIDARLAREAQITPEYIRAKYPPRQHSHA